MRKYLYYSYLLINPIQKSDKIVYKSQKKRKSYPFKRDNSISFLKTFTLFKDFISIGYSQYTSNSKILKSDRHKCS